MILLKILRLVCIVFLIFMVIRLLNLLMDYQRLTNWFTEVSKKNCRKFRENVIGNSSRCKSDFNKTC